MLNPGEPTAYDILSYLLCKISGNVWMANELARDSENVSLRELLFELDQDMVKLIGLAICIDISSATFKRLERHSNENDFIR